LIQLHYRLAVESVGYYG